MTTLPLLLALCTAILAPLVVVVPAYYRGRARTRAGMPPGWNGPGWRLRHVWLAFSLLIAAELLVLALLQPALLAQMFGVAAMSAADFGPATQEVGRQILWTSVAVGLAVLAVVPFVPLRTLFTTTWSVPRAVGAGLLAFLVLRLATILLAPVLPEFGSGDHPQRELTESLSQLTTERSLWVTFAIAAVFAPLVEEILFRGVLLTGLARHLSFGWANLIQAALFASLHLSLTLFPLFVLMGVMAGELMRRSGGLLAPFTLHALNNASAIAALWWLAELHLWHAGA